MSTNGGELAKVERPAAAVGERGIQIRDYDGLARLAQMAYRSGLAGKAFQNVEAVGVAIGTGLELGLSPFQSLQCITVINGKPGLNGAGAKALVEASGLLEDFDEWFEVKGQRVAELPKPIDDSAAACCMAKRRGRRPTIIRFGVADAKMAGLWGRQGPWSQYPSRMLKFRALGFCLNDTFPDVLKGFKTVEELADYPDETSRAANTAPPRLEPPAGPKVVQSVPPDQPQTLQEGMAEQTSPHCSPQQMDALSALADELKLTKEQRWDIIRPYKVRKIADLTAEQADAALLTLRRSLAEVLLSELNVNLDDVRLRAPIVKADLPAELAADEAVAAVSVLRNMVREAAVGAGMTEAG